MAVKIQKSNQVVNTLPKILLRGESGVGKSLAALKWPRVLMVDPENRAQNYSGEQVQKLHNIQPFEYIVTQRTSELLEIVEMVRSDKGKTWDVLDVDPISVFYYNLVEAWTKKLEGKRDNVYTKVNQEMRNLLAKFSDLPVTVIMTARNATKYKSANGYFEAIGDKASADDGLIYWMDYVLHIQADHTAIVEKQTGIPISKDGNLKVKSVGPELFKNVYAVRNTGVSSPEITISPEDAVKGEVGRLNIGEITDSFQTQAEVVSFIERWKKWGTALEILAMISDKKSYREVSMRVSEADQLMALKTTQPVEEEGKR